MIEEKTESILKGKPGGLRRGRSTQDLIITVTPKIELINKNKQR